MQGRGFPGGAHGGLWDAEMTAKKKSHGLHETVTALGEHFRKSISFLLLLLWPQGS